MLSTHSVWLPIHAQLACALLLALVAGCWDLRTGRIPNRLVAIGVLAAVALAVLRSGWGQLHQGAWFSLGGALICMPLPVLLYLTRSLGGGDGKLFMALGALLGPIVGLQVQLHAFCLGSLYVIGVLIYRGELLQTLQVLRHKLAIDLKSRRARAKPVEPDRVVKFGPVICLSVLVTLSLHWSVP